MTQCSFPNCHREAEEDRPALAMCRLHKEINETDYDYTEAITAAEELIPALTSLARSGMCNDYLVGLLEDTRQRAYDDAARYKLAWDLAWTEADMDKEE